MNSDTKDSNKLGEKGIIYLSKTEWKIKDISLRTFSFTQIKSSLETRVVVA